MNVGSVTGAVAIKGTGGASPPSGVAVLGRGLGLATLQDQTALAEAFAKAAKLNALPLGNMPAGVEQMAGGIARSAELSAYDAGQEQDALASLLTPAGGLGAPTQAAPPPPTSFVDPSAFADLLSKLWLREQGRTTREVRVSFGDSAWPATGARLIRLEDGTLQVAVLLGDRGAGDHRSTEALKERLQARGLPVSDISFQAD